MHCRKFSCPPPDNPPRTPLRRTLPARRPKISLFLPSPVFWCFGHVWSICSCIWWVCSSVLWLLRVVFLGVFTIFALLPPPGPPSPRTALPPDQTCTLQGPGASNTTKIPREDFQERGERKKNVAGEEKKARKFGPPTPRGPTLRGPTLRGPTLQGPIPSGPHPWGPTHSHPHNLAKCGLAKFGRIFFGQMRSNQVGQMRSNKIGPTRSRPNSVWQLRSNTDGQIRFGQMRS